MAASRSPCSQYSGDARHARTSDDLPEVRRNHEPARREVGLYWGDGWGGGGSAPGGHDAGDAGLSSLRARGVPAGRRMRGASGPFLMLALATAGTPVLAQQPFNRFYAARWE